MSTTIILTDNISIYASPKLVGGFALNYVLENTGPAILDAQVNLVLVQDVGGLGETSTVLQSWKKFNITPSSKEYFEGSYFLSQTNFNQILSMINPELLQKYQITCVITGGANDTERLALVKMSITNAIEYSVFDSVV